MFPFHILKDMESNMNTPSLAGRRAIVTGGSRGIGAAIARRLAADGAKVCLTYSTGQRAGDAVAAEIVARGGHAFALKADGGDVAELRAAIDLGADGLGGLDTLVNNAGVLITGAIDDYSEADFDRMVAVNVRAMFFAVQQAIRHMQRGGRIINIASNAAIRVGNPKASVYALTKSAVTGMTRGLAYDLGPRGITVNAVLPGPTATEMVPAEGPVADYLKSTIPLGRMADPSEIASLVAYLASDDSSFVNGASMTIDGGVTA